MTIVYLVGSKTYQNIQAPILTIFGIFYDKQRADTIRSELPIDGEQFVLAFDMDIFNKDGYKI
jgi:hypothetical protein